MRIVLDTNVVIDALASRAPWNAEAEEIFLMVSGCTRRSKNASELNQILTENGLIHLIYPRNII